MDYILPVSGKAANFFRVDGEFPPQVRIVYTGIDTEYFNMKVPRDSMRKELGVAKDVFVIGIVGQLVPIKGHRELFRALANFRARSPRSFICVVVGDGPDREYLETYATELGIAGHIVYAGFRSDIPEILASLDVLVAPSHTEASSRVILEAGAMEIPTIGTRVGGIPEMIEENKSGLLVGLGDIDSLANALLEMTDERLRRRMGEYARRRVEERFSNRIITKQVESIYQDLLVLNR